MKFWAAIGAFFMAILSVFRFVRLGQKAQQGEQASDTLDRVQKGRDAIDDGDPVDRVRRNDGKW